MIDAFGNLIVYLFLDGFYQLFWASGIAATILPLVSLAGRWNYLRLLIRFALFNAFLLAWGGIGNAVWLCLTADRFWVLDDAPVWAPYILPTRAVFNHAGGGPDAWELLGQTTFPQLYLLWAVTAIPVWLLAGLSVLLRIRWTLRPSLIR